ncbi:hypothetical protein V8E54_005335 [Elaphomyces granulatus]
MESEIGHRTRLDDFSVAFSLSNVSETEQFVAREEESSRKYIGRFAVTVAVNIVVLHGLGGIGKTQLTVAYAKRHKDNYSAIFWLNIKDEDSLSKAKLRQGSEANITGTPVIQPAKQCGYQRKHRRGD